MSKDHLHEIIDELHEELERSEHVDEADRTELAALVAEIRAIVGPDENPPEGEESVTDRLLDASRRFEESHPSLVSALGRLADALSKIGV